MKLYMFIKGFIIGALIEWFFILNLYVIKYVFTDWFIKSKELTIIHKVQDGIRKRLKQKS